MFLHHAFPRVGTNDYAAFQNAINDISKENEVFVTNPILILIPPKTDCDAKLTFLKGKGFIASELNTGEARVRQSCA